MLVPGELLHRVSLVLEECEGGEGLGPALRQVVPPAQVPPPLTRAPVSPLSRQRGTLAAAAVVAALLCGGRAPQLAAAATWCLLRLAGVLDCVQGELRVLGEVTASQ